MGHGGGIYIAFLNGHLHLIHCSFINNTAPNNGGALYSEQLAQGTMHNCIFEKNRASRGGAWYSKTMPHEFVVQKSTFSENVATVAGGALYIRDASINLSNSEFWGNVAPNAAALLFAGDSSALILMQCHLFHNKWDMNLAQTCTYCSVVQVLISARNIITHTFFHNNMGTTLYLGDTRGEISQCEFVNNFGDVAGAIRADIYSSVLIITNTNFSGNTGRTSNTISLSNRKTFVQGCNFELPKLPIAPNDIVIVTPKSVDVRFVRTIFTLATSPQKLESVVSVGSSFHHIVIPATVYFWKTFVQQDNDEIVLVDHNIQNPKIVTFEDVNLTEKFSQFASGQYLGLATFSLKKQILPV